MEKNEIHEVNIEDTNIIPVPVESRKIYNKKLIIENPLKPQRKKSTGKIILLLLLFMIIVVAITTVIYRVN